MTDRIDQEGGRIEGIERGENRIFEGFLPNTILNNKKPNQIIKHKLEEINFQKHGWTDYKNNIEKTVHPRDLLLNNTNPRILEEPGVNARIDAFIRQVHEELARRQQAQRVQDVGAAVRREIPPLAVPLSDKDCFGSATGVRARIGLLDRELSVNGEKVTLFKSGYTEVNFIPEGRVKIDQARITESLTRGIEGMIELIDAIDQGIFKAAPIFVGTTNINMALVAQRLGFVITDECRTADGNIDRGRSSFTVVGRLNDIRSRVEEFKRSGKYEQLTRRNERQQLRPKVAVG